MRGSTRGSALTDLQQVTATESHRPSLPGADVTSTTALGLDAKPMTPMRLAWRRFRRHKLALVSSVILITITVMCVCAPWLAKYGPNDLLRVNGVKAALLHPQSAHWFGTNERANDMWSNVLYAGRVSLGVGIVVALASTAFGTVVGVLAGFYGGWLDNVLMRITDLFLAIPFLILAILLTDLPANQPWARTIIGPSQSVRSVIFIIAIIFWMPVARILRGLVLSLKEKEFVEAARAAGASNARIMWRHLVPNCTGQIIINTTLSVAAAILTESALSFLGKGVDIFTPTWGNLLGNNQGFLENNPTLVLAPGFAIILTVICVNFIGDGLRDAFDPKQLSV
jgi:peptide/nickel transport system permease protein